MLKALCCLGLVEVGARIVWIVMVISEVQQGHSVSAMIADPFALLIRV